MNFFNAIDERYAEVKDTIRGACFRSGRKAENVHLIAVSKLQPVEAIEHAYQLGMRDFGENYSQELCEKKEKLSHLKDIRWHLIGTLQSNKVKTVIQAAHYIHSIDSERLVIELARRLESEKRSHPYPVFLQVNIDEENTKSGVLPHDVTRTAALIKQHASIQLKGLMCIPMARESAEEMRAPFSKMRELLSYIEDKEPLELSMGMSEDFEIAVEEGSNWIRVGRRLFGDRIPQK